MRNLLVLCMMTSILITGCANSTSSESSASSNYQTQVEIKPTGNTGDIVAEDIAKDQLDDLINENINQTETTDVVDSTTTQDETAVASPAVDSAITQGETAVASPAVNSEYITQDEAKTIALNHAGVSASNTTFIKCQFDFDNGIAEYEVDFYVGTTEYDYEINAVTGAVISFEQETKANSSTGSTSSSSASTATYITQDEAKTIALNHAGVSVSDTTFIKCQFDFDDGIAEYEVDFYVGTTEYDYEINATTGAVISFEQETKANSSTGSTSSSSASTATYITQDEAKTIALNHAGLSASEVTSLKCEFDFDNGIAEYEVEFKVGRTEYDYEINASTGAIISFEKDYD